MNLKAPGICLIWLSASLACANLINNGGFEDPHPQMQPERFYSGTVLGGWLVGDQVNDYVSLHQDGLWAKEGIQYLFMSNFAGGEISQTVNVQAGREYVLRFSASTLDTDIFVNPPSAQVDVVSYYPAGTLQSSYVIANAFIEGHYVQPFTFGNPLAWRQVEVHFTARADDERLFFRVGVNSPRFVIDQVSLVSYPSGDLDGDLDVDGADFVIWQTNFPASSGHLLETGDADCDGDVDGADFVVWQSNFPFTPGPAASPVPEPTVFLLGLLSMPAMGYAVRCGRKSPC